jgi:hypothetical protein
VSNPRKNAEKGDGKKVKKDFGSPIQGGKSSSGGDQKDRNESNIVGEKNRSLRVGNCRQKI